MHGLNRIPEFNRAFHSSQSAVRAIAWDGRKPASDLKIAEGMFSGVLLVTPFWLFVGCILTFIIH